MPLNFEKYQAIFAENYDGSKVLLPDHALQTILKYTIEGAPWKSWGTNISISSGDTNGAGTLTVLGIIGGTRTAKAGIGAGTTTSVKVFTKTGTWEDPYKYNHGFTAHDKSRGFPATGAEYSMKFNNQELLANGRKVMNDMLTAIDTNNGKIPTDLMDASVTPDQALDLLLAECVKVKNFNDDTIGIDGVAPANIIVQLQSDLFQKIIKTGRAGNFTQQVFTGGIYIITTIGGYRFEANDFMPADCQAIIGTNFTWFTADTINAMKVSPVDNLSNDVGVYNEYAHINFGVYDKILRAFVKS